MTSTATRDAAMLSRQPRLLLPFAPLDELGRRGFLTGAAGAATLLGLSACSSRSTPDVERTSSTRTVATIHGNITVPAHPTRIVAVNFPEACALLDLGIAPVGRPNYMPDFAPYAAALKPSAVVTDVDGKPLVEKIAALRPDLIVTADWAKPAQQQMNYPQLSVIAPTAVFTWEQSAGNWQDQAAKTAGAVNHAAGLTALKQRYTTRAAEITQHNAALLGRTTWDLIDCSQHVWDLYSAASSHGGVLTTAGVHLGAAESQVTGYQEYSFERFDLLADTDVIVTTSASLPFLHRQPTFMRLPAVRAGRLYATDLFFPASYGIALALLDNLSTFCTKAANA